jgi:hypothetical protein
MIYELRIHHGVPGRMSALLSRSERDAADLGEAQHPPGRVLDDAWDSMAGREKRWGAFLADSEWAAVVAKTEKDRRLVENISNQLLKLATFSSVK